MIRTIDAHDGSLRPGGRMGADSHTFEKSVSLSNVLLSELGSEEDVDKVCAIVGRDVEEDLRQLLLAKFVKRGAK